MKKTPKQTDKAERRAPRAARDAYGELLGGVVSLIEQARLAAIRSVNVVLTSTYWLVGQRIVEHEQSGSERAGYGQALLKRLAQDLTAKLGRGFSERNIEQMRLFYLGWPNPQTVSANSAFGSISQTLSAKSSASPKFPLPWSHYVRLLSVTDAKAREYYEREALSGGWSVRQLDRQIASLAYQRTSGASVAAKDETLPADAHVRDPFVLEFLNLTDEYSETELENALIRSIEQFLLELGNDFAFVARQKRLRVGSEWYRVDLVFFHRRLRCLIIVDLKLGKFTHADAGQMNLYLNYAREHWTHPHENPPVGLILCSEKDAAVAHYALGNLANQVLAREYQLNLPDETEIADGSTRPAGCSRLLLSASNRPESDLATMARRFDISDKLIHFTGNGECSDDAFTRLRGIIREGRLIGSKRKIRGGYRCVSFTEAPLDAFSAESIREFPFARCSQFGLMFERNWIYARGGRPVIYRPECDFDLLSEDLRWRHVRFEPTEEKVIDWTWEREWRIWCDELEFTAAVAAIVVPNVQWEKKLRRIHDAQQDLVVELYAEMIDRDIAEIWREEFPWRVVPLG